MRTTGNGGQGRIRTFVPRKEGQIYSLLALTTHPPVRSEHENNIALPQPFTRLLLSYLRPGRVRLASVATYNNRSRSNDRIYPLASSINNLYGVGPTRIGREPLAF